MIKKDFFNKVISIFVDFHIFYRFAVVPLVDLNKLRRYLLQWLLEIKGI